MHPIERDIRARCESKKRKIAREWERIDYAQICRDLTAQMNAEIGAAERDGRIPNRNRTDW